MKFEALTYTAHVTDYSVTASAPLRLGRLADDGRGASSYLSNGIAAFLLRLAAYFHSALGSLPRSHYPAEGSLTFIDTALDNSCEPLQKVRMNRHLSRRLRWLIRRGRVESSGELRLATAKDEARCRLTPGQFNEYCIRAHGWSRIRVYGLGFTRRGLFLNMLGALPLRGDRVSLSRPVNCNALITPD